MEAISLGFSMPSGLSMVPSAPAPAPVVKPPGRAEELFIGTPSITIIGLLLALIEVPPRIRIRGSLPISPLFAVTTTPGTRACSKDCKSVVAPFVKLPSFNEEIAPVTSLRDCVPYPITTTSSPAITVDTKVTSITARPLTATSAVS